MEIKTGGSGIQQEVNKNLGVPAFDPRTGNHLWVMVGMWRVDPEKAVSGEQMLLDTENLINVNGPGCYYCEKPYNHPLASKRCKGYV
jgi:hypothetical protein